MASNYEQIRRDNEDEYGKGIKRWGPRVFTHRYDDRSHFIYEILQNAEDALARRGRKGGARSVSFELTDKGLDIRHFGKPFDEPDVRGICGIAESTKADLTAIGRFGIGFKSVYAFTNRPEVHSGAEDFAIENFVWPIAAKPRKRDPDETLISLPLKPDDKSARDDIAQSFKQLGPTSLLFLREIEEIRWRVVGGASGLYLRESKQLAEGVRQLTLVGQEHGQPDIFQEWLVFSKPVTQKGKTTGHVELAFLASIDKKSKKKRIQALERSPLIVFFPTVVETHLGFLIQGPYRTTPSRDNVPHSDDWNQHLVSETASLMRSTLHWLADHDLLDTVALQCLPLDVTKFGPGSMLEPLYVATGDSLREETLLPCFGGGLTAAKQALISRTQELRELLQPSQLTTLFEQLKKPRWLSSDITHERTPALRRYLIDELEVEEITPDDFTLYLSRSFLEQQSDAWIRALYEFLNGQPALRYRLKDIPLVRLTDGTHVKAQINGQPQAFLAGKNRTDFPTVRPAACGSDASREFLTSLGLTEPDPVDDVVRNLLPKYSSPTLSLSAKEYEADIARILTAFDTNSRTQRDRLIETLRQTSFVRVVDAGKGVKLRATPSQTYLSTERFRELFSGVPGVLLVDDEVDCLRGERVREVLEASGATRVLQPLSFPGVFSSEQLREMRRAAGCENKSTSTPVQDYTLRGLQELLSALPRLDAKERTQKARALWEALGDLEDRRGTGAFSGSYKWFYHRQYSTSFDAVFVRTLNRTDWIPDASGRLQRPDCMVFERLGWKDNPFLTTKIRFKPPVIEQLAKEAGFDPRVLDMLKKHGIKNAADLAKVLGIEEEELEGIGPDKRMEELAKPTEDDISSDDALDDDRSEAAVRPAEGTSRVGKPSSPSGEHRPNRGEGEGAGVKEGTSDDSAGTEEAASSRQFFSYIAAAPEEERDPDRLTKADRDALEEKAIQFILGREQGWQRTQQNNRGFDLYRADGRGNQIEWVEVKAMTGAFTSRPVGMSRPQFDTARLRGESYWLYVVELAGKAPRLIRIKDPAGRAKTFTFDHGWVAVAEPEA
jgi:hypothetical protein